MDTARLQELSKQLDYAIKTGLEYDTWAAIYAEARKAAGPNREALDTFESEAEDGWLRQFHDRRLASARR